MDLKDLRQKFLDFFKERGHKIVPSSSLLPTDPSVLFTSAGMQQFKEYYLEKPSPYGNKITSCQKCFRTSDIEEVGDTTHLTFLEMLGNFSFGDYFKKESIKWAFEFLTKDCGLKKEKLWITVFEGNKEVPEDKESREIWKELGFVEEKIHGFSREDNFWGPTGEEGPCGPTTEIHYELSKKPCSLGKKCLPNCKCGRFIELWNLVFNEFYQDKDKNLTSLKQKGVDTGMGLERLTMVCQGKSSVFETDLFEPILKEIEKDTAKSYNLSPKPFRIIVDHIRGAVFLISEGIFPSNIEKGYILRRVLRRAIRFGKLLDLPPNFLLPLAQKVVEIYKDVYPEVRSKQTDILIVIQKEEEESEKSLEIGINDTVSEIIKTGGQLTGDIAFKAYESRGVPLEVSKEIAASKDFKIDKDIDVYFEKRFKKHQEISRAGREKKFGGVGKGAGLEASKLHTATHLMHQALRQVLGDHVKQMGSDITSQRLRFDFFHFQKLTAKDLKKIEDLVNQKIKEDLEVKKEEVLYKEAINAGALAFFKEKYPERVTVYSINDFSKEICAGPHTKRTSELGHFKIIKEESSGASVRRIRAILE